MATRKKRARVSASLPAAATALWRATRRSAEDYISKNPKALTKARHAHPNTAVPTMSTATRKKRASMSASPPAAATAPRHATRRSKAVHFSNNPELNLSHGKARHARAQTRRCPRCPRPRGRSAPACQSLRPRRPRRSGARRGAPRRRSWRVRSRPGWRWTASAATRSAGCGAGCGCAARSPVCHASPIWTATARHMTSRKRSPTQPSTACKPPPEVVCSALLCYNTAWRMYAT